MGIANVRDVLAVWSQKSDMYKLSLFEIYNVFETCLTSSRNYAICSLKRKSNLFYHHLKLFLWCTVKFTKETKQQFSLLFSLFFRARRAAKEAKEAPAQPAPEKARVDIKKFVKIGRPGYKGSVSDLHFQLL